MSTLSLRVRTLIFGVVMLQASMLTARFVLQEKLTRTFAVAERNAVVHDVVRGKALVDDVTGQLDRLARDWGHWDDMRHFLRC